MKILNTLLLCTLANSVLADTTLIFTDGQSDKAVTKMQFANNKMRASSANDNSTYMIYDANNTTFTMYMADDKQYFVLGKEQLETLGDVGAMMDKMLEEQLSQLPASQREMMRGMMAGALKAQMPKQAPKAVYSFTGETSSYNGFDCKIVSKKAGKNKSNFCVTEYSNLGMSDSEYSIITSFQKTIEKLASQMGSDNSMDFSSLGNYMPVQFNQSGQNGILNKVHHDKLEASLFTTPQDYNKVEMPF